MRALGIVLWVAAAWVKGLFARKKKPVEPVYEDPAKVRAELGRKNRERELMEALRRVEEQAASKRVAAGESPDQEALQARIEARRKELDRLLKKRR